MSMRPRFLFSGWRHGYGNFNNMQRLVRQTGAAPHRAGSALKTNSSPRRIVLSKGEPNPGRHAGFCGKIKAGKDARTDPEFSIMQSGGLHLWLGLAEALRRAEAIGLAGPTASSFTAPVGADEILSFNRNGEPMPRHHRAHQILRDAHEVFRQHGFFDGIWAITCYGLRGCHAKNCADPQGT